MRPYRFNYASGGPKGADIMRLRPSPRKHVTGTSRPRMECQRRYTCRQISRLPPQAIQLL